jgi:HEAT repeat protein
VRTNWLWAIRRTVALVATLTLTVSLGTGLAAQTTSASGAPTEPKTSLPKHPEAMKTADAVEAYVAVLLDETQTNIRRNYAGGEIVKLGKPAVPALLDRYKQARTDERGYLASLLGAIGRTDQAEEALVNDLKTNRLNVHPNVIKALGEMGSAQARPLLGELLAAVRGDGSDVSAKRLTILQALAGVADETSADALKQGLDDKDRMARAVCSNGLVALLQRMKAGLDGKPSDLVRTGDKTVPTDSKSAAKAYAKVLDAVFDYCQWGKNDDARVVLASGLGQLGDEHAEDTLLKLLKKGTPACLRSTAADSLGKLKSRPAVDRLSDMLADDDPAVGLSALRALVAINDRRCVPAFIGELGNTETVRADVSATDRSRIVDRRRDLARGLATLTGQSFGENAQAWKRWWASQEH